MPIRPKARRLYWIKDSKRENKGSWSNTKFYHTKEWRALRNSFIKRFPICAECYKNDVVCPANVVDHIKPIAEGGAELDVKNLQSLCTMHHNQKSAREGNKRMYKNKGEGGDES